MEQYMLVKFDGNWADEMDIKGFEIVKKEWWDKFVESLPENKPLSHYIGSNEEMEWTNKADYLRDFTVTEISEDEVAILKKLFPYGSYGSDIPWMEFDEEGRED
jgi:hypothetical protein